MTEPFVDDPVRAADHIPPNALLTGIGLYAAWAVIPIYFKLLTHVGAFEVVLHRIIWSLPFLAVVTLAWRQGEDVVRAFTDRRTVLLLGVSALLISGNWLLNVIGIEENHLMAISLGYFLTPLVNVALGVAILRERFSSWQLVALLFALMGVVVMAIGALTTLGISLGLALSFGVYGFIRKLVPVAAITGLTVETALLAPVALFWLISMGLDGTLDFGTDGWTTLLLLGCGVIPTIPLLLFGNVVRQLPLGIVGLLQYIAPSLQFVVALWLFKEPLNDTKMTSFALIWVGLAIFTFDASKAARRRARMVI